MRRLIFSVLVPIVFQAFSQESKPSYNYSFKLFHNLDFYESGRVEYDWNFGVSRTDKRVYDLGYNRVSIALNRKAIGKTKEFEVELSYSQRNTVISHDDVIQPVLPNEVNDHFLAIGMDRIQYFDFGTEKLIMGMSPGLLTYIHSKLYNPNAGDFRAYEINSGILFSISPRLNYMINNRLGVEINARLPLTDIRYFKYYGDNPAIVERLRGFETWSFDFLPGSYHFRTGLVYRI